MLFMKMDLLNYQYLDNMNNNISAFCATKVETVPSRNCRPAGFWARPLLSRFRSPLCVVFSFLGTFRCSWKASGAFLTLTKWCCLCLLGFRVTLERAEGRRRWNIYIVKTLAISSSRLIFKLLKDVFLSFFFFLMSVGVFLRGRTRTQAKS